MVRQRGGGDGDGGTCADEVTSSTEAIPITHTVARCRSSPWICHFLRFFFLGEITMFEFSSYLTFMLDVFAMKPTVRPSDGWSVRPFVRSSVLQ